MAGRERWDRITAVAAVIVVEAACVAWLARFRVDAPAAAVDGEGVIVEFISRSRADARRVASTRSREIRGEPGRGAGERPVTFRGRGKPILDVGRGAAHRPRPPEVLDLRVTTPDDTAARRFASPVPGASGRFKHEPTRFDAAWQGGGTLLEEARRRSPVLGIALSLFGGPGRHCDEIARRLRKPDCLPEEEDPPSDR